MSYWRFLCHKFDFNNSQNLNSVNSAHIGEKQKQNKTVQTKKQPTTKKQTDENQPQKKKKYNTTRTPFAHFSFHIRHC